MKTSIRLLLIPFVCMFLLCPSKNSSASGSQLTKGPYLIYDGINTRMHVLWQTAMRSDDSIRWRMEGDHAMKSDISLAHDSLLHNYTISELSPGSRYFYTVVSGGKEYNGEFYTAPDQQADHVKFIAYGDTRRGPDSTTSGPSMHNRIANMIDSLLNHDEGYQTMILESGDLVVDGNNDTVWQRDFFDARWTGIQALIRDVPLQACIGNHENNGKLFQKYFPYPFYKDRYWSFDYGPAHISVIDQFDRGTNRNSESVDWFTPGAPQYKWLEHDLQSSQKPWKILLLHEPGWSASGDTGLIRLKGKGHTDNVDVQRYVEPLCEKFGVHLVIGGHNHFYSRAKVMTAMGDSVFHITSGGGGAPLYDSVAASPNIVVFKKVRNFCKVNIVSPTRLEMEVVSDSGTVIDAFTIDRKQ